MIFWYSCQLDFDSMKKIFKEPLMVLERLDYELAEP